MTTHDFSVPYDQLPAEIPVFPLDGVLLLPRGQLPLNIFEKRYLAMVDDAIRADRLIGMIQPQNEKTLFRTGCVGKIISFNETDDGRYLITLKGVCRFGVHQELAQANGGYRRVRAAWGDYKNDLNPAGCLNIDRERLKTALRTYFDIQGMNCDWNAVDGASDEKLITCLAMVCPFDSGEKQALLEAACCKTRAELFISLLEMAIRDSNRKRPDKTSCH